MNRVQSSFRVPARVLNSLVHLQDGLNTFMDPDWRQIRHVDDWALAITMESAELIDSYPWKWWKNVKAQADMHNVRIEIADILHFSLSGEMQKRTQDGKGAGDVALKSLKEMGFFCRPPAHAKSTEASDHRTNGGDDDGDDELLELIFFPLTEVASAVATFRNIIQLASIYRFDLITKGLLLAAQDLDFNLVGYYVAKYTLNQIRQLKGYKEGAYVKVREGVEDNELLHECVQSVSVEDVLNEGTYLKTWEKIACSVFDAFGMPEEERRHAYEWLKSAALEGKR
ncbi:putative deoxyuridine triphosphatase [Trypanosoma cruzi]|nr:putative deoxyuridine triphosphatase [Trypanosoma cruzi]